MSNRTVKINITKAFNDANYDAPILILDTFTKSSCGTTNKFETCIQNASKVDPSAFKSGTCVIPTTEHPSGRLIVSVTGNLNKDYDDSRRLYEAAGEGISKAYKMGLRKPLLLLGNLCSIPKEANWGKHPFLERCILLGALNTLYTNLMKYEYAETEFGKKRDIKNSKADLLGLYQSPDCTIDYEKLINEVWAIEEGKRVARDIGGSDPIRMTGKRIAEYLEAEFKDSCVKMESLPVSENDYPLAAAVNRGAKESETQSGRIIKLTYEPLSKDGSINKTVFLVGKGVTYDTGGHDLKVGGNMQMMHRDKCGAGVVAGFFKTLSLLKPDGLKCVGRLGCIRNAIGPDAYVSDEIITARSGVRVRVNNTDAEGRMVMADLLGEMVEEASNSTTINPHVFTVATLTGHAINTYGEHYGAIVTNRVGRTEKLDMNLQNSGELMADMFEVSRLRREDWHAHVTLGNDEYADLTNSFAVRGKPFRGHQSPAVFLMQASGLDKRMESEGNKCRIQYTHLDIAGPEVKSCPNPPTAAGLSMLVQHFMLS